MVVAEELRERLRSNLRDVRFRMEAAAKRAGRDSSAIRLMAVTKTLPREIVQLAKAEGLSLFGENRVQEAQVKYEGLLESCELHLIGHLQRNKARMAAGVFRCVQSIDKTETAEALSKHCAEIGRDMDVLLELNTSGEQSKSGFAGREELLACVDVMGKLPRLRLRGLMTVGPLTEDGAAVRASFSALRGVFAEISAGGMPGFDTLSMGMSGDFEIAIEEGATLVRVGTALFGPRTAVAA